MGGATGSIQVETVSEYETYSSKTATLDFVCALAADDVASVRTPLDVVLCVDKSGSMSSPAVNGSSESKMQLAKAAALFVARQLKSSDRLGLVAFDSSVDIDAPLDAVSTSVEGKIKALQPNTCTNGSGALLAAIKMLRDAQSAKGATPSKRISAVILLTDGAFNEGISNDKLPAALQSALDGAKAPISIHCFGFGPDYNEELLHSIAKLSSGNQYHVQGKDDLGTLFADALGGLLSVVAQNVVLTCKSGEVHKIGDMYAGERKAFIFSKVARDAAAVKVEYFDVLSAKLVDTDYLPVYIDINDAKPATVPRPRVAQEKARMEAIEIMKEKDLATASSRVRDWKEAFGSLQTDLVSELAQEMDVALVEMKTESAAVASKKNHARMAGWSAQRAHKGGSSAYTTSAKMAMQANAASHYDAMVDECA